MRTVGSRVLGLVGVVVAAGVAVAACSTAVAGSAQPASLSIAPTTAPTTAPPPTFGDNGDSASQQAQQTCSQLPKDAVTTSFGVTGVTVTADSGTTLTGGILQIKCVINASGGFRANVVVQIYPGDVLSDANQYLSIMQQKFPGVQQKTVSGADVGGLFQQTIDGGLVDEAFAATKDTANGTVDVVLAGIADSPGIDPKLLTFITALAKG